MVNFSVPLSEKTYRHRVGRTARAGQAGIAVTLVSRDVAHSFLELEAAITPHLPVNDVFPDEGQSSIPKWPVPLPNASAMLARRRMVDVAWSRASKVS